MMCRALVWSFNLIASINWLEVIRSLAPVVTAFIAFLALKNWQRQDKAKRESEFLDAMIEAVHAYIAEMGNPIMLFDFAKIGIVSHAPTWEDGDEAEIAVKGAIAYIEKNGERDAKRLRDMLEAVRPSVIKLRSLTAKGQVFAFDGYAKCHNAVVRLTWQFDRIEAFTAIIGSPTWNWEHPDVLRRLKDMMSIQADEIRNSLSENNIAVLEFASATYKRIYG